MVYMFRVLYIMMLVDGMHEREHFIGPQVSV